MKKKNPYPENEPPPSLFDLDDFVDMIPKVPQNSVAGTDNPDEPPVAIPPPTSFFPHDNGLTGIGPLRNLMDENFLQFAAYSICSRAIPTVEDGLKPVQRRILHALWEKDDGRYTKVANIVGHTMQYHPHGDASIGDALVVLANKLWGEGKGYVIDGQGNFGNLYTGMPAAASRYIECRLTDLARNEIFNKKTTDFTPSYDGRNQEPILLPAKIPLLLMLGADGIAVGLSTAILPHNFIELLEAQINIIQKKPFQIFPDFQLGGVMDVSEYEDGNGRVKIRAKIEKRDKNKLSISQLPWGETTDSIITSIEDAYKKKKIKIRHIHDLTAQQVDIEIELAPGESQDKSIKALYAFTTCEKTIASRPIVLDAGRPTEMTVSQILRKNTDRLLFLLNRELEIRKKELDDAFHNKTLEQIFIEERIYKLIEEQTTNEAVKQAVLDGFVPFRSRLRRDVTLDDVNHLLEIKIRRISRYDINKNREEIEAILREEAEVESNIKSLKSYAVRYLKALIKKYRDKYPRCTTIQNGAFQQIEVRALTATELTIRYDKENGYIGSDVRGGEELFKCSSLDRVIVVWLDGRYRMMPPPDKFFVDKTMLYCKIFSKEILFTAVYTEPHYGFTYIKRFKFSGCIQNKDYRLAPENSKIILLEEGTPDGIYVKYKPAKAQRIHQQMFVPSEVLEKGVGAKGIQMTSKDIARISSKKPSWWDDTESSPKGLLS